MAELMTLPAILAGCESDKYITPEELTYWKARENRTFYIDYEIGEEDALGNEDYGLIELGKIIIQMNIEEITIDKKDLKPIYLYVHSYGGSLAQANFFCDLCLASRIPIITIGMGICMSAGFLIFLAGQKRFAFKHSQMLAHEGSAAFQGTASEIEQAQKNYKKQIEGMKKYILERTEIPESVFNRNKNKDWYLTVEELTKYKVCNKIVDSFDDILI